MRTCYEQGSLHNNFSYKPFITGEIAMYTSKVSAMRNIGKSYISQEAANAQALEMDRNGCTDCSDCEDCHHCVKCVSCKHCSDCINSFNLDHCDKCVECSDLSYLSFQHGVFGAPSGG